MISHLNVFVYSLLVVTLWSILQDAARTEVSNPISHASHDTIRIQHRTKLELTGDHNLEIIHVTALGTGWRSLQVQIEIISASGESLYLNEWDSSGYFHYPPGWDGRTPEQRENHVRDTITAILGDQQAFQADMIRRGHRINSEEEMRRAIEWDLIEERFPNLMDGVNDTREYRRRYREARLALDQERINTLHIELKQKPKFIYLAWGEAYYGLAWSNNEDRFVRIYLGG